MSVKESKVESLILAMNVVLPILIMMTIGYLLKQWKIVDQVSLDKMNGLVFRVFMSSLLFVNIYSLDARKVFRLENIGIISFPVACTLLTVFFSYFVYSKKISDKKQRSVMIQGAYRGNFVLFGIPIASTIYGVEALGMTSLLLATMIPTFNISAIILLESCRGGKATAKKLMISLFRNPLMIATVLGILCVSFKISLHPIVEQTVSSLSRVTTPLAFIILGGSLEVKSMKKHWKYISSVNFIKLILFPMLTITLGHYLGFGKVETVAFLGSTACPTAVASFSMAKEMGADGELAGEIVVSTSVFSIVTIFLWIVILKNIGWI